MVLITVSLSAFAGQEEPNVNSTISMTHECVQVSQEPLLLAGSPTVISALGFLIQTSERVLHIKMNNERYKEKLLQKIVFLKRESGGQTGIKYSFDSHLGPKMQITEKELDEQGETITLDVTASGSSGIVSSARFSCTK